MIPFSSTYSHSHPTLSKIITIQGSKFLSMLLIHHIEAEQDPGGAPGHGSLSVSPVPCFQGIDSSLQTSLSSKELLIGKGGDAETKKEQSRNNWGVGAGGYTSRGTHNNIFKLFTEPKHPANG